jgi:hypothetical protein
VTSLKAAPSTAAPGTMGAALRRHALDAGWRERIGPGRAVRATPGGLRTLSKLPGTDTATIDGSRQFGGCRSVLALLSSP